MDLIENDNSKMLQDTYEKVNGLCEKMINELANQTDDKNNSISLEVDKITSDIEKSYEMDLQQLVMFLLRELQKLMLQVSPILTSITKKNSHSSPSKGSTDISGLIEDSIETVKNSNFIIDLDKLDEKHAEIIEMINNLLSIRNIQYFQQFNDLANFLVLNLTKT